MNHKQCKLCLDYFDKLSKSHIIPRWAAKSISENLRSISRDGHVRRSPMGPYDKNILCYNCEKKFGPFDNYAANALKPLPYEDPKGISKTSVLIKDSSLLTIFFLSVLWRAHISSLSGFNSVDLGPKHSQTIKSIILNPSSLNIKTYPIILAQINWDLGGRGIIPPPIRLKMNTQQGRLNGYTLWIGDFLAHLFIDSRMETIACPLFTYELAPTIPLLQVDFSKTLQARALIDLMGSIKKPFSEYVKY